MKTNKDRPDTLCLRFEGELPDARLCANQSAGMHPMERHKLVKAERQRAGWLLKGLVGLAAEDRFEVPVKVTFRIRGHIRHDADNWAPACKPWLDAIVDYGLLRDDRRPWVVGVSYEVIDAQEPCLDIRLEPVESK